MTPLDPFQPPDDGLPWRASGISGVARQREWDAVQLVELAAGLDDPTLPELGLYVFADRSSGSPDPAPAGLVDALAAVAGSIVPPPCEALCVRRPGGSWSVGARSVGVERVSLSAPPGPVGIGVAVVGDDEPSVSVDGELVDEVGTELALAVHEILERARGRFRDFAARAERIGLQDWALSVDPL